jgi:hypothetical protein
MQAEALMRINMTYAYEVGNSSKAESEQALNATKEKLKEWSGE